MSKGLRLLKAPLRSRLDLSLRRSGWWLAISLPWAVAGCSSVLAPVGPVGTAEKTILVDSLFVMLLIVVPVICATIIFAWWFRSTNKRAHRLPDWAYSGRIEIVTWSVPTLIILFLAGLVWTGSHDLDPAMPLSGGTGTPLDVQVVSLDWKWLFIYPDEGIASLNQLVIPAGRPVHFSITSASVFNSFFIPRLGSQIYAMNGMVTHLNLRSDRIVSLEGMSAHFSGDGFPGMHFKVEAVEPAAFKLWIANADTHGAVLDVTTYRALLRQSVNDPATTFRSPSPGLFDAIARQQLPPGLGPAPSPAPSSRS